MFTLDISVFMYSSGENPGEELTVESVLPLAIGFTNVRICTHAPAIRGKNTVQLQKF